MGVYRITARMKLCACAVTAMVALGCGGSDTTTNDQPDAGTTDQMLPGFTLPAAPAADVGMRFISPITKGLEPGSSHEICSWTGVKVDNDIDLRKVAGYQAKVGHHIILFASHLNYPAGTSHECTDAEMASFRMVAASGSEGLPSEAPGDLVYRIDSGMYIVMQEHYLNEGDEPVDSQSALDIFFADKTRQYTPSHAMAFLNSQLDLPVGASSLDVHCTMQEDVNGWYAIPHMHEWGAMFNASITHAGVTTKMFDDLAWKKEYMFSPPAKTWDVAAPETLHKDDTIDVHCEWNNTTTSPLHFGSEMCVFFVQTIDTNNRGNLDCDNGSWGSF